jgi:DNA-binding ferritin-like protein
MRTLEDDLKDLLGAIHILSFKTKVTHFYVKGISFKEIHELFGSQYDSLIAMQDRLGETIIINKGHPCISMSDSLKGSSSIISEFSEDQRNAVYSGDYKIHVSVILAGNEALLAEVKKIKTTDRAIDNILAEFEEYFSKQVWVLSAYVK